MEEINKYDLFTTQMTNENEYKLSDIRRYNGKVVIKEENVAEHSFYTVLNVLRICEFFDVDHDITFKLMAIAAVHDLSEYLVGDIPFEFKIDNPEIMKMFEQCEIQILHQQYKDNPYILGLLGWTYIDIPIIKLADEMCAWQYATREINLGSKHSEIYRIWEEAEDRVRVGFEIIQKQIENGEDLLNGNLN